MAAQTSRDRCAFANVIYYTLGAIDYVHAWQLWCVQFLTERREGFLRLPHQLVE